MDSSKIEAQGLQPLRPLMDSIDHIGSIGELVLTVARFKQMGSSTLFSDFVTQDDKNSSVMAYKLWQGGLGLPEREYYFRQDSATAAIRKAYQEYISTLLQMIGKDSLTAIISARRIMELETQLAGSHRKLEDLRDPYRNYNKMSVALCKAIDWKAYLKVSGIPSVDSIIVGQPEFFKTLGQSLGTTPIEVWRDYVLFNLVNDLSFALPDRFGKAAFEFSRLFSGAKVRKARWKRVVALEENAMGELMGKLYVQEFFNEKAKQRYERMVEDIRGALKDRIQKLDWMSDSTKAKAYVKLAAMNKKVGYPDKWKDFSSMDIGRDSWVQNAINASRWWHAYRIAKLGKPVDREEWEMYPQTYNAYYNPSNNEIVLPAGIFTVPGYRDEELDDATVYGYAGASTIGHEITHGFDDEGRQFDAQGNLVSWWTSKDETEFTKRADLIIRQFNEFEPLPGMFINGKATTGENIADLGGVLLGIDAYKKTNEYREGKVIQGKSPLQRYFLGYALGWLSNMREASLRNQLLVDVHAPAKYRVNGPFMNVEEFYEAFGVKPGNKLFRADSLRVKIW
jgi:putative endopeptidase